MVPPPENIINSLIRYEEECIENVTSVSLTEMNTDNMNDYNPSTGMNPDNMIQSIDENRFINETTYKTVPIGYLLPKESTTKSFTKRQAENIFQGVMGGYNRYSEARQHKVSMLILKLQDLMTVVSPHYSLKDVLRLPFGEGFGSRFLWR